MATKELTNLQKRVKNELHWMQDEVDDLSEKGCEILLDNKERYRKEEVYCRCCNIPTKIKDMNMETEICNACKGGMSSKYLQLSEFPGYSIRTPDEILTEECNRFKKEVAELYLKFNKRIIKEGFEPLNGEVFQKHFKDYAFMKDFHFSLEEVDEEDINEIKPIILSSIRALLVFYKKISVNADVNKFVSINGPIVTIKDIPFLLEHKYDGYWSNDDCITKHLSSIVDQFNRERQGDRDETKGKIKKLIDQFMPKTKSKNSDKIILDFCKSYVSEHT